MVRTWVLSWPGLGSVTDLGTKALQAVKNNKQNALERIL